MSKTADKAYSMLKDMATNSYQWPNEHSLAKNLAIFHEIDPITSLSAQVSSLTSQTDALTTHGVQQKVETIVDANMPYFGAEMDSEQVQYVNNSNFNYQGNNVPNYYHPRFRNHENFFYGNAKNVLQPSSGYNNQVAEKKPSLEDLLVTFMTKTRAKTKQDWTILRHI